MVREMWNKHGQREIYGNHNGCIGSFNEATGEAHKEIYGSRGMLRKPPALCFDCDFISTVESRLKSLSVKDRETGRVWFANAETFFGHRILIDRGQGSQWALPMKYWAEGDGQRPELITAVTTLLGLNPAQLSLFGMEAC